MRSTISLLLVLAGCLDSEPPVSMFEQNGTSANGTSVNGTSVNGTSVNGTSVNGTSVNGTSFTALSSSGPPIAGTSAIGATWILNTLTGSTVTLRIDTAEQGTGTNSDLWFYGVSYKNSTGTTWASICPDGAKVLPVAGTWSSNTLAYASSTTQFTWACRGKTIAKCVELGYKTFKGYTNQLASCVRMLRGDYCGTGIPYTVDGQLLNVYDNVGVQFDTQGWNIDAEWAPTGARCISNISATRFSVTSIDKTPPCLKQLKLDTCGTFRTGTYLIDEWKP